MMQTTLSDLLASLLPSFCSVDVRIAACRDLPVKFFDSPDQPPTGWQPFCAAIRISSRHENVIRQHHAVIQERLGPRATERLRVLLDTLPVTALPALSPTDVIAPRLDGDTLTLEARPTSTPVFASIRRKRQWVMPWGGGQRPAAEFLSTRPSAASAASDLHSYLSAVEAEVRRTLGIAHHDLIRSYLELLPSGLGLPSAVAVEVEMPARILSVSVVGRSIDVDICFDGTVEQPRASVASRHMPLYSLVENHELTLTQVSQDENGRRFHGRLEFANLKDNERIECNLIDSRVGVIDEVMGEARSFMPAAERNPLLVCLRRFWNLDQHIYRFVERPLETTSGTRKLDAALAFQAAIARLLTLAGFQTIDLGRADKLKFPNSQIEAGTADLLAYHSARRVLIVGACTIGVPKDEDYEKLLHVTELLRQDFPDRSRVVLIPSLFTGQQSEATFRETLAERGLRLLTHQGLLRLRELIEADESGELVVEWFLSMNRS